MMLAKQDVRNAKGQASYENKPVEGASFEDLDSDLVREYAHRIGSGLPLPETLAGRNLMVYRKDHLIPTIACVLLFAKRPQNFVSRCGIDFLRFEGTEMLTGRDFNVIKREIIEKPLPRLIDRAIDVVGLHIKERRRLTPHGIFETVPEYPPFAWQEAIINAVAHRDYSITGRSIQIRMFDDRLEIDSPGKLPGPVRLDNLARERFSRNPQIVRALIEFGYMRDVGEGIDRMIKEMERHNGCPPEFAEPNYSFVVTLRRGPGS
jgi:ATP-dependent DNA helicase RecG